MKLLRYGPAGYEKPGLLDASGTIRDLSGVVDHVTSEHLSDKGLAKLAKIKPESLPMVRRQSAARRAVSSASASSSRSA